MPTPSDRVYIMFNVITTDKNLTFFIGDIHGEFKAIKNWIDINSLSNCNLIFCGDFGFGFSSIKHELSELSKPNKKCIKNNVDCYIIRGNHDDPSYYNEDIPKVNFSNIKTVSDYTIIQTPEHNILCVGGAVSVDRINRKTMYDCEISNLIVNKHYTFEDACKKAKLYWWENEAFKYREDIIDEIKKAGYSIDVVATHSAPDFCQPTTNPKSIGWTRLDDELEKDLIFEREQFTKLYNHLIENGNNITHWFYGHYHMHHFDVINETKFIALDMGRLSKEGGNVGGYFDMAELR